MDPSSTHCNASSSNWCYLRVSWELACWRAADAVWKKHILGIILPSTLSWTFSSCLSVRLRLVGRRLCQHTATILDEIGHECAVLLVTSHHMVHGRWRLGSGRCSGFVFPVTLRTFVLNWITIDFTLSPLQKLPPYPCSAGWWTYLGSICAIRQCWIRRNRFMWSH